MNNFQIQQKIIKYMYIFLKCMNIYFNITEHYLKLVNIYSFDMYIN
jgi:hypothetical protein